MFLVSRPSTLIPLEVCLRSIMVTTILRETFHSTHMSEDSVSFLFGRRQLAFGWDQEVHHIWPSHSAPKHEEECERLHIEMQAGSRGVFVYHIEAHAPLFL
jgi:hypothetical protein